MPLTVTDDGISDESAALAALGRQGLHVLALDVEPVLNDPHWHHFDAEFHVLSGSLELTDAATGRIHACGPGSRVRVPARALHAEHSPAGYRIALGTSVAPEEFGDPVNRPPETL
jgi:mannose-6-phosphate isomerase-like protein (cupin superfamily)